MVCRLCSALMCGLFVRRRPMPEHGFLSLLLLLPLCLMFPPFLLSEGRCAGGLKLLSSDKIRRFLLAGDNKSAGRYNSFCARTIYIHGQDELWTWNGLWCLCNTDIFESGPLLLQSIQCYRNDGRAAVLCSTDVMSLFCALHIKRFMEAIKCTLNGEELAEWMYNWISSYDGAQSKTK